ncbi:MAG: DUF302 domain-containing protein [Gammaproteobacteria bacterium]|nr:DUF302 domain-containing protein [Gammaproteobacteria bacterium]
MKISIKLISIIFLSICASVPALATSEGVIRIKSHYSAKVTIDNLEKVLKKKGMTIFSRINHTAGAEKAGLQLRPTELLIFGNPKVGTPLMHCAQTAALDLPQKALAYEDENGQVWLAYNDPAYMANRHKINGCNEPLQKINGALENFSRVATE